MYHKVHPHRQKRHADNKEDDHLYPERNCRRHKSGIAFGQDKRHPLLTHGSIRGGTLAAVPVVYGTGAIPGT